MERQGEHVEVSHDVPWREHRGSALKRLGAMNFYTPQQKRKGRAGVQKEEAQVEAVEVEVDPKDIPDVSKYEQLSSTYEDLKWRIISRPGGATMKPLNFYRMKGRDATHPALPRHTARSLPYTPHPHPVALLRRRAREERAREAKRERSVG
jgi:hypothetical protein